MPKKPFTALMSAELAGINLQVAAKLDTGAKTASLSARDIKRFKRDGESWVRFYLAIDDAHSHPIERPLARVSKIKRRPGITTPSRTRTTHCARLFPWKSVWVKLTHHRSELDRPKCVPIPAVDWLRSAQALDALVDPSLKYAAGKPACAAIAQTAE